MVLVKPHGDRDYNYVVTLPVWPNQGNGDPNQVGQQISKRSDPCSSGSIFVCGKVWAMQSLFVGDGVALWPNDCTL